MFELQHLSLAGASGLLPADQPTQRMPGGIALKAPGRGDGRRRRMIFEEQDSCYHVMSRTTGGDMLFGEVEKEAFRKLMWRMARFSGIEILTYVVMGNHFHILIRVPRRERMLRRFQQPETEGQPFGGHDEEKLLEHLKLLYSESYLAQLRAELAFMKSQGTKRMAALYEKTMQNFYIRFCSLEHFMKELKERFSRWFNKQHDRVGTLWQARYKSVLVGSGEALKTMAAYIDLNAVRGELVEHPQDYRWCGYAEAMSGNAKARRGICRALGIPLDDWFDGGETPVPVGKVSAAALYRMLLFTDGMEKLREKPSQGPDGKIRMLPVKVKRGMSRERALTELEKGGIVTRVELLRCRVRYFSEGLVLGSSQFVKKALNDKKHLFSPDRKGVGESLPLPPSESFYSLKVPPGRVIE